MSDNPLEYDEAREQRIRERAYHLWEADGSPHGNATEYWERASELEAMSGSGHAGQLANPIAEGIDPNALPVEEAFLQENLGEFPDRLSDQGEHPQTPSADNTR